MKKTFVRTVLPLIFGIVLGNSAIFAKPQLKPNVNQLSAAKKN